MFLTRIFLFCLLSVTLLLIFLHVSWSAVLLFLYLEPTRYRVSRYEVFILRTVSYTQSLEVSRENEAQFLILLLFFVVIERPHSYSSLQEHRSRLVLRESCFFFLAHPAYFFATLLSLSPPLGVTRVQGHSVTCRLYK